MNSKINNKKEETFFGEIRSLKKNLKGPFLGFMVEGKHYCGWNEK